MPGTGDALGPYVLGDRLGDGAFGSVFRAHRHGANLSVPVVVKLPHDPASAESALTEAETWLRASGHPNVVPVQDAGFYDSKFLLVTEYVSGGSLRDRIGIRSGNRVPVEEALDLLEGILRGLEHLHANGIIHCDLKPENVLLQAGVPRLNDFGVARLLSVPEESGAVAGTPAYMPPEAFSRQFSVRTDVWAAGVILYELLTGWLPFDGGSRAELIHAIQRNPVPLLPDSVPPAVRNVVQQALQKNTSRRFSTAAEMRKAIEAARREPRPVPRRGDDVRTTLRVSERESLEGTIRRVQVGERQEMVEAPAGAREGDTLRFAGKGLPGNNGGERGDLIIAIEVIRVPERGADLPVVLPISWEVAWRGGPQYLTVEGISRLVSLPPRSRNGDQIRVTGEGRPGRFGGDSGDLVVLLQVSTPPAPERGEDLLQTLVLTSAEALRGGAHRVYVGAREEVVWVPPYSRDGQMFWLFGKGRPGQHGGLPGDLKVVLRIHDVPYVPPGSEPQPAPAGSDGDAGSTSGTAGEGDPQEATLLAKLFRRPR